MATIEKIGLHQILEFFLMVGQICLTPLGLNVTLAATGIPGVNGQKEKSSWKSNWSGEA